MTNRAGTFENKVIVLNDFLTLQLNKLICPTKGRNIKRGGERDKTSKLNKFKNNPQSYKVFEYKTGSFSYKTACFN